MPGLPGGFRLFLGGGRELGTLIAIWGSTLLKIIICIKSGTLLGSNYILGGSSQFFWGGDSPPLKTKKDRPPGSPACRCDYDTT